MTRCDMCGKNFPDHDLRYMSLSNGREVTLCSDCLAESRALIDGVETGIGGYNVQPRAASRVRNMKETHVEQTAFKQMQQSLSAIGAAQERARREEEVDPRRKHLRHEVGLKMQFSILRDSRVYEATVRDISQGGLRFFTKVSLSARQVVKALVFSPSEGSKKGDIANYLEVRWVETEGDGYLVGGRFMKRVGVEDSNRRRHRRRKADCSFFYRRPGSVFLDKGKVLDISQSGMRVAVDCFFEGGEEIEVILRTAPPAFVHADLRGYLSIVRCITKKEGSLECGGFFTALKVTPVSEEENKAG